MSTSTKPAPRTLAALLTALTLTASTAHAAITTTGNVEPTNPATWTTSTTGYIGKTAGGSLTVSAASTLLSYDGNLGFNAGITGSVTVTGSGSTWNISKSLDVGASGTGILYIANSGSVTCSGAELGAYPGGKGTVTVNGSGSTWINNGSIDVGATGTGTLNITNSGTVTSAGATIASTSGSTGSVTVDGSGSIWANTDSLYVGYYGTGNLTIKNGGSVTNTRDINLGSGGSTLSNVLTVTGSNSKLISNGTLSTGYASNNLINLTNNGTMTTAGLTLQCPLNISTGGSATVNGTTTINSLNFPQASIAFGSSPGAFTTTSLYASPSQITGTATINAKGLVSDVDLLFDATHGLTPNLAWNNAGQNITLNLDLTGSTGTVGDLGAGYMGTGSLTIKEGVSITSANGSLASNTGSVGTATVDGPASQWNITNVLTIGGGKGTGNLIVTNGATVNCGSLNLGNTSQLNLSNNGTMTVQGQTYITGASGSINFSPTSGALSTGTLHASTNQLTGTGTINTHGLISNVDLTFDATHAPTQTLRFNNPGQNITVNLDLTGATGNLGDLGIGYFGSNSLTIKDGVTIKSSNGRLVSQTGTVGTASIDGFGTTWNNSNDLTVSGSGTTTLNITHGANVSSVTGNMGGTNGTINVDGIGSQWINSSAIYVGYYGTGTLNITHGGVVSNTIGGIGYSSQGISITTKGFVTVDGSGSSWTNGTLLLSNGSLSITNGGTVTAKAIFINNYYSNTTSILSVDGPGSTFTNTGDMYIGFGGSGNSILKITNGGKVFSDKTSNVGETSATGLAVVNGAGSSWSTNILSIGMQFGTPSAILNIINGGHVSSQNVTIYSRGLLTLNIGDNSLLDIGTGPLTNSSKIRFQANAGILSGNTYSPITAGTWSGTGTVQALGGTWNATTHTFTVSPITNGTAGTPLTINPLNIQRVTIYDLTTPLNLIGASFLSKTASSSITFTASLLSDTQKSLLQSQLPADATLLSGWNVSASGNGYATNDPIYLTLPNGGGWTKPATNLTLWHFDGTNWATITPSDFSSDNLAAYFTITSFSGYALTGTVPEPTTLSLLALGSTLLLTRRPKNRPQ